MKKRFLTTSAIMLNTSSCKVAVHILGVVAAFAFATLFSCELPN